MGHSRALAFIKVSCHWQAGPRDLGEQDYWEAARKGRSNR